MSEEVIYQDCKICSMDFREENLRKGYCHSCVFNKKDDPKIIKEFNIFSGEIELEDAMYCHDCDISFDANVPSFEFFDGDTFLMERFDMSISYYDSCPKCDKEIEMEVDDGYMKDDWE